MSEFPDIPGYRLHRELGRGGMASVYLATQISLEREVALKVMASALAADRSFSERFLREARTVAQLQHPAIVPVYDMGVAGHLHFLAMEYLPAGDLKRRLRDGTLATTEVATVLRQIALALDYAHGKGFVHRDVKPENILFRDDGSAVLSDFGIARAMHGGTRMTGTGLSLGTPHYMSPEQALGHEIDGRSDLYSLGVVLHEMLTGAQPYTAQDSLAVIFRHVNEPIPRLPRELASTWQAMLDRLMAKDPGQRYQTGREIADDLDGGGISVRVRPRARTGSRFGLVAAGVAVLAAAVVATLLWLDRRDGNGSAAGTASGEVAAEQAGTTTLPSCPALRARVDQVRQHLIQGELLEAVDGLRDAPSSAAGRALVDCAEAQAYRSLVLVAGAHAVKEVHDVERLQPVLAQALQKAGDDLEQLQRLAQLAQLSGDGIGAAEASVAIENAQDSIANMRERADRVSQRGQRLHAAGRSLSVLLETHADDMRSDRESAQRSVAGHPGMESMQRELSIFLANRQDLWKQD